MFQMLKYKCKKCGGYTDKLASGDRCLSCAYAPSGRPTVGGDAVVFGPLPEPDWNELCETLCGPAAPDES